MFVERIFVDVLFEDKTFVETIDPDVISVTYIEPNVTLVAEIDVASIDPDVKFDNDAFPDDIFVALTVPALTIFIVADVDIFKVPDEIFTEIK